MLADRHPVAAHWRAGLILSLTLVALCAQPGYPADVATPPAETARDTRARAAMIEEIAAELTTAGRHLDLGEPDPLVLAAMGRVRRHRFVPDPYRRKAYANHPLPIGHGQTISQPLIVALMSQLLSVAPEDRVLEIGTGSGYQAAVLAEMGVQVSSIEIIRPLAETARERLRQEGYGGRVQVTIGDGYFGWEARAPFDAIIVTAAADHIPPPLIAQLKPGGRMVIPVGGRFAVQQLVLVSKAASGEVATRQLLPVRFVPLTRGP